jgi:phage antirepressor YoqD-like protein
MAKPKIKVSNKALVEIMRSDEMLAEVTKRAEAIAAAANAEYTGTGEGFVAHSNAHSTRARGTVVTATNQAYYAEAKYGLLTKSMDAGRN